MIKRYFFISCFIFSILGMNSKTQAQIASDLNFIIAYNPIDSIKVKKFPSFSFNETNELKLSLMGLIRGYQLFISTQDMPVCNFDPSCSNFGMVAFKEYGIFHGLLMTSDRLQRCHGMGRKYYPINPETGKSNDPPKHNFLGNK